MALLGSLIMSWVLLSGIVGTGLIGPNRSSIEGEFHLSHAQFGLGVAAIQICASLTILLAAAPRLRRLNSVTVLMLGLALQAGGFATVYAVHSLLGLAAGWVLITLGTVIGSVVNNLGLKLWPHNPRRGVTLLHGFNAVGKVLGPLIAAACLAAGWRLSFLAVGAVTFALFAVFGIARGPLGAAEKPEAGSGTPAGPSRPFGDPFYWLSAVLPFALIAGGEAAFVTLLPLYLERVRHFSKDQASVLLTVLLLGLMAGRFASAQLTHRVSNRAIIGACLAAGVFVVPALFLDSHPLRLASLFLMGWMFSSTWPTYYAHAARLHQGRTDALAYGSAFGNVTGISLCILLSSAIADYHLTASLFFGPAMLWLFGLIYYAGPLSRGNQPGREPAP